LLERSIAPIRQPRLLPPSPDDAWHEDVCDALPTDVQRDVLRLLAQLLTRWFDAVEGQP
jgi:hypothetical protein